MDRVRALNKLLPLVAIGTVADCQSILENTNRLLVSSGLQILNKSYLFPIGLSSLLVQTGLNEKIQSGYRLTSQDLGFVLSPILNSSGRVSHASLSISVLVVSNNEEVDARVQELITTNQERKLMVKSILKEVEEEAEKQFQETQGVIWLQGDWSKGIVGLLASRIVNQYNLPVVVVADDESEDEVVSASLRAPEGYHLPNAMKRVALFEKFGGHPGAAGFGAKKNNLSKIKDVLAEVMIEQSQNITHKKIYTPGWLDTGSLPEKMQKMIYQTQYIWLRSEDVNLELMQQILSLDPFGQDFPMPELVFEIDMGELNFRWIGSEYKHIKVSLESGITATIFNIPEKLRNILLEDIQNISFWVQAKASQNSWKGQTSLELLSQNIFLA